MPELIKQQDTRREFIDTLMELAAKDPTITLSVPDVGFSYIEEYKKTYPNRYFNNGATELFTVADAAGQAIGGLKPHVYSMINFVAFRPFEAVRNCIAHHNVNVKLLGVKGSSGYAFLGFSHNMAFENEDTYHLSPYMDCYVTQTPEETRKAVLGAYEKNKSCYIRL